MAAAPKDFGAAVFSPTKPKMLAGASYSELQRSLRPELVGTRSMVSHLISRCAFHQIGADQRYGAVSIRTKGQLRQPAEVG